MQWYLFVCTGNYYRSRLAEILFNHWASEKELPCRAFSRGLEVFAARNEGPISTHTLEYLQLLAIEPPNPLAFPEQLKETDLALASRVILLDEAEHRPMLKKYFPGWENRVECWAYPDIQFRAPEEILPAISKEVRQLMNTVLV